MKALFMLWPVCLSICLSHTIHARTKLDIIVTTPCCYYTRALVMGDTANISQFITMTHQTLDHVLSPCYNNTFFLRIPSQQMKARCFRRFLSLQPTITSGCVLLSSTFSVVALSSSNNPLSTSLCGWKLHSVKLDRQWVTSLFGWVRGWAFWLSLKPG